jgi:hypothetical protein
VHVGLRVGMDARGWVKLLLFALGFKNNLAEELQ